jgi:PKD repeat protein
MMMITTRIASTRAAALLLTLALTPAATAQLDADFTVNASSGTNPFTVQFTDTTTGGPPFVWGWDFGDGHSATGQNPSHTYTLPGTHTVKLSVLGPGLEMDQEVKVGFITVAPLPLAPDFSATGTQGSNPLTVSFTDLTTGTPPTAWLWDFGDGAQSTAQHPSHVYDTPGTFDVALTAFVDQQSDTTTQVGLVTVDPATLVAAFSSDVAGGDSPLVVGFTDTSTAAIPVTAWLWDFGDGGTSTEQAPSHTYVVQEETGFDVTLTVFIGGQSDSVTVVDAVRVEPGLFAPWVQVANYSQENVGLIDVADLNGDGMEDLLLFIKEETVGPGRYAYAPNQGPPGAFGVPIPFGPLISNSQWDVWPADPDGDGDLDLLIPLQVGDGVAWIEHLDGSGTFAANDLLLLAGSDDPSSILCVDLDGDGDDDLLAVEDGGFGTGNSDAVWYEHLDGAGSFGPRQVLEQDLNAWAIDTDDLDGDGDLDVILGAYWPQLPRGLFWYENLDGMGSFGPANTVHSHQLACDWVAAHDLDGDGDGDLIGRFLEGDALVGGYQVYENVDGQGTYELARVLGSLYSQVYEFLLDPDGDGDLDLVEVRRTFDEGGGIWWAENRGGPGLLDPWKQMSVDEIPYGPAFGDLDGDGDRDFVYHRALTHSDQMRLRTNRLGTVDWPFLGDGLQGSLGMPRLQGEGTLIGGGSVTVRLTNGLPGASSTLVAGLTLLAAPLKGGVLLPNPDVIISTGPLDGDGELELVATWPLGIPAGAPIWFQWWLVDGSGPLGFTASNGVMATTGG